MDESHRKLFLFRTHENLYGYLLLLLFYFYFLIFIFFYGNNNNLIVIVRAATMSGSGRFLLRWQYLCMRVRVRDDSRKDKIVIIFF